MTLDEHRGHVSALTPKAAKIALRLFDRDPDIPVEWIIVLRPLLVERSSAAPSFGGTDWMTIAGIAHPRVGRFTAPFASAEQRHARLFVESVRQASRK